MISGSEKVDRLVILSGAGTGASPSDLTGALDANSSSSSSSKSSSRLTLRFSVAATGGLGASCIVLSCVSGSAFMSSTCDISLDESSTGVDSGDVECGILRYLTIASVAA